MAESKQRSSRTYPELARFPSPEEAKSVTKAWRKQMMKSPVFWLALIAYGLGVGISVALVLMFVGRWFRVPPSLYGGLSGGLVGGSSLAVVSWFWRRSFRRFLREALIERGIPICLKCGYDLRGQIEARCPECGTGFDASLISTDGGQAAAEVSND